MAQQQVPTTIAGEVHHHHFYDVVHHIAKILGVVFDNLQTFNAYF